MALLCPTVHSNPNIAMFDLAENHAMNPVVYAASANSICFFNLDCPLEKMCHTGEVRYPDD